jgi:hypothetical protein
MKGIVFNLLEEIVRENYGEETWDALLDEADLSGAYTSLGSYPDEHLGRLVAAASTALSLPPNEIVRWVGREALPRMARRFPHFFALHTSARSFVLTLNDIIHPEVRKLYPGANVPEFEFDATGEALVMHYRSARKMCAFAQGLVEGAGAYYGETVEFAHERCMHHGDTECVFRITFTAQSAGVPAEDLRKAA